MNYEPLNMPDYSNRIRLRKQDEQLQIFDSIRGKWLVLTPEEWVRQNTIIYISDTLEAPISRIANEVGITYNGLTKRCDSIIYDDYGNPLIIIEYKRTDVQITQRVFDQIATSILRKDTDICHTSLLSLTSTATLLCKRAKRLSVLSNASLKKHVPWVCI